MNNYEEFEYVEETKKKSKKGLILIIIIIFLIAGAVFSIFYFTDLDLPWKKHNEDTDTYIENLKAQNKTYSKESDLIIPKFTNRMFYNTDDVQITSSELDADKNGYFFELTIQNKSNYPITIICDTILIDKFQTDANFNISLNSRESENVKITITKTELLALEIRDFNSFTFFGQVTTNNEKKKFDFNVYTEQIDRIKNEKKGVKIDSVTNIDINYIKKIEDNSNYYLYFDIVNSSKTYNYNVLINKLLLNNKKYELNNLNLLSHFNAEKVFYLTIPKDDIKEFDSFEISFFVVYNYGQEDQIIRITNSKKIDL